MAVATFTAATNVNSLQVRNAASWAAARGATTATEAVAVPNTYAVENQFTGGLYYIARSIFTFLTGTTLQGATITSATLRLYGAVVSNPNSESVCVAGATPADPASLVQADIDNITLNSPTEFASRIAFSSISTSAYNDFALNASGLAAINKTSGGYTNFSIRSSYDVDNTTAGASDSYVGFYAANDADVNKRPVLTVTYELPSNAFLLFL